MALGVPTIVADYGGVTQFAHPDVAWRVGVRSLTPAFSKTHETMRWAAVDTAHAQLQMRRITRRPREPRDACPPAPPSPSSSPSSLPSPSSCPSPPALIGAAARSHVLDRYSSAAVAAAMVDRLNTLAASEPLLRARLLTRSVRFSLAFAAAARRAVFSLRNTLRMLVAAALFSFTLATVVIVASTMTLQATATLLLACFDAFERHRRRRRRRVVGAAMSSA